MRPIATNADLNGPSAGLNYSSYSGAANTVQSAPPSAAQPMPVTQIFGNLKSSFLAQPIAWLAGFILILVGWKLIEEHRGEADDFKEVKIGVSNWAKIGFMMLVFFAMAKFLASRYEVPGISSFVAYSTGG